MQRKIEARIQKKGPRGFGCTGSPADKNRDVKLNVCLWCLLVLLDTPRLAVESFCVSGTL